MGNNNRIILENERIDFGTAQKGRLFSDICREAHTVRIKRWLSILRGNLPSWRANHQAHRLFKYTDRYAEYFRDHFKASPVAVKDLGPHPPRPFFATSAKLQSPRSGIVYSRINLENNNSRPGSSSSHSSRPLRRPIRSAVSSNSSASDRPALDINKQGLEVDFQALRRRTVQEAEDRLVAQGSDSIVASLADRLLASLHLK